MRNEPESRDLGGMRLYRVSSVHRRGCPNTRADGSRSPGTDFCYGLYHRCKLHQACRSKPILSVFSCSWSCGNFGLIDVYPRRLKWACTLSGDLKCQKKCLWLIEKWRVLRNWELASRLQAIIVVWEQNSCEHLWKSVFFRFHLVVGRIRRTRFLVINFRLR